MSDVVQANLDLDRRGYELWNVGGVEASLEHVWAPDIVFYELPDAPDTGIFRGAEAFAARCRDIMDAGGHFQFDVRSLEGRGEYTLAALDMSVLARGGVAVTTPFFHVARWGGGRLRELRSFLDPDQARAKYERLAAPSG